MEALDKANRELERDMAKRKRAEEELRWKTAFLEAQVDSALDGILVVDHQGMKILQNQRMNELWKIPPRLAESKDDAAQVQFVASRTKTPKEFAEKVAYLNSHPDAVSRDEIELVDGTVLDRYSSPVRDKAGKYYGRIWAFRDITEHRKLEAQFRQVQKMEAIGQLAAGVAHDFNNILAVIQLQASMLKAEEDLSSQQLESAREIEKAAERAANLTRQLLLFSRKQTMQPRDLDLNQSINDMTKMLRRTIGEVIQVQFKFSLQPLLIHADAGMMDQVLMNLAVNAHDAMPQGGQLVIETSAVEFDESVRAQSPHARPGSFVCLSVGDTGCGIPPENLSRIFEPFFTTKDVGKGTGLGLATVFGIVQQHQGWINVYSEVGRGTTFRVYLPRLAAKSGQESGQPALTTVRGGKEMILLVEDESALRASVRTSLSQLGYRVLEAVNGVEALDIWKRHHDEIKLLLTDLVMPGGMTGVDLAGRLLLENPKLKVIYTSGYSAEVAGKNLPLEEGVNFLNKPYAAQHLAQAVRNCLDGI
jgi:signal transduction histidine kinase/ActR/RegA family two-component response regulator